MPFRTNNIICYPIKTDFCCEYFDTSSMTDLTGSPCSSIRSRKLPCLMRPYLPSILSRVRWSSIKRKHRIC